MTVFSLLFVLLLAGCATAPVAEESAAASRFPASPTPKRLRVLTTNDLHGTLVPEVQSWTNGKEVGGAATLVAYFEREEGAFGGPTIKLDGGDMYQGTPVSNLTEGRSTIDYFNAAGYAAAALGNHEFDWGVAVLAQRAGQARFPFLAANVFYARSDSAPRWIQPTTIVRVAGPRDTVTVGIVGFATRATPITTRPKNVEGLEFRDPVPELDRWVRELRSRVDFVIVIAHEGAACDSAGACSGEILNVARRMTEQPDLIVGGHTHQVVATRANGIPVVEAGTRGQRYGMVDLVRTRSDSVAHADLRGVPIAWTDSIRPDPAVAAMVARYLAEIGPEVNRVIATMARPLEREIGDYALGRLIADAQRAAVQADVAIMNNGGIRTALPAGPVTWTDLFKLQPFANRVIKLEITGEKLRTALEHGVASGQANVQVSGLSLTFDPSLPAGRRITRVELDGGRALEPTRVYSVAVNDFLAAGGDGFTAFANPVSSDDGGIVDLDALIAWMRSLPQPVAAPPEARIRRIGP
jgi:2',3'-cyclic-nucleotide 2'-phosphodiesterase (5'-nucleotidase family)